MHPCKPQPQGSIQPCKPQPQGSIQPCRLQPQGYIQPCRLQPHGYIQPCKLQPQGYIQPCRLQPSRNLGLVGGYATIGSAPCRLLMTLSGVLGMTAHDLKWGWGGGGLSGHALSQGCGLVMGFWCSGEVAEDRTRGLGEKDDTTTTKACPRLGHRDEGPHGWVKPGQRPLGLGGCDTVCGSSLGSGH